MDRTRTLVWDLRDLDDPLLVREYYSATSVTDHNLYVRGDRLYMANNVGGLLVLDLTDPEAPATAGSFDTTPSSWDEGGFGGAWSVYPFFESGTILLSSRREGLFLVKARAERLVPRRGRAGAIMCSVLCIFEIEPGATGLRRRALDLSWRQRHRGPDWSGIYAGERAILAHERLSTVDVERGAQPLFGPDRTTVLAVNGEIYNHAELERGPARGYPFRTRSDCEVILALYEGRPDDPAAWLNELSGIFAFALYDEARDRYLIVRDPIGVMPLYTGAGCRGALLRRLY